MSLQLILCELDTVALAGAQIGEVLRDTGDTRQLSLRLLTENNSTAGFAMRMDNPMAQECINRNGDVLLKAYWYGSLVFIGDCMSMERSGAIHHIWKRDGLLTQAYSLGSENEADVKEAHDDAAIAARGRYEEVVPGDVGTSEARQALVDANVAIRKTAQQTISFDRSASGDDTLALTFAGPLWRLSKRLSGKTVTGNAYADVSRSLIPQVQLNQINRFEHDTGIRNPTSPPTLEKISVGPFQYKPTAELFTDVAQLLWPVYYARENFSRDNTADLALSGTQDDIANTWALLDGPGDWVYSAGNTSGFVSRATVNQPDWTIERAGSVDGTDQTVAVTFGQATTAAAPIAYGVALRIQGVHLSDCVVAYVLSGASPTLNMVKRIGGTKTNLQTPVPAGTAIYELNADPTAYYRVVATIRANGDYSMELQLNANGHVFATMTGNDSQLATGGPLASGGVGILDVSSEPPATASLRYYSAFSAINPAQTASTMDFDLVPNEPTVDTDGGLLPAGSIRIARLLLASTLGTTKPEAIFEYGTGKRADPLFGTDYVIGDTVTARSKDAQGNVIENDLARVFGVDISVDKNGKETVQPLLSPN